MRPWPCAPEGGCVMLHHLALAEIHLKVQKYEGNGAYYEGECSVVRLVQAINHSSGAKECPAKRVT